MPLTDNRVFTAPLAIIKANGIAIGKMRTIQVSETIQRTRVQGLGRVTADELPVIGFTGNLTCALFMVDFRKEAIPNTLTRNLQNVQQWEDNMLLGVPNVQIDILRKVAQTIDPVTGAVLASGLEIFASIRAIFANRESFDISDGQISGRNLDFEYLDPILFPL